MTRKVGKHSLSVVTCIQYVSEFYVVLKTEVIFYQPYHWEFLENGKEYTSRKFHKETKSNYKMTQIDIKVF